MTRAALFVGMALGALFLCSGNPAMADLIIDPFDAGTQAYVSPAGTTSGTVTAASAVGGNRYAVVTRTGGSLSSRLDIFVASNERASFSNDDEVQGWFQVSYGWDGTTQTNLNQNLSLYDHFELSIPSVQGTGNLVATVYNSTTSYATSSIAWPTSTGTWNLSFSSFGSPDWSDIDRFDWRFTTTSASADMSVSLIAARPVPEPSTILLLLCGGAVCGVVAHRRRRRK